jgi:hypothetical protein
VYVQRHESSRTARYFGLVLPVARAVG